MKKKRLKPWILNLIIILSLGTLIFSSINIFMWYKDNQKTKELEKTIVNEVDIIEIVDDEKTVLFNPPEEEDKANPYWDFIKIPFIDVNFNELKSQNSDTIGWIEVKGTNVNYPVVQTADNEYYLKHSFDKTKNSAGWVYADYRNNFENLSQNTIIYGHGRLDKTVFGSLHNVLKESWYNDHNNWIIRFATETEKTIWQIFSVYTIEPESYYITPNFSDNDKYQTFLDTLSSRSIYNFDTSLTTNDKIITLSTCKDNTYRLVIHAKLIKSYK